MLNLSKPDLTQHPPRSARVRLGGFAHLPRLLDKARAFAAGRNGAYNYNCALDRSFFDFSGINHEALLTEIKKGSSDSEMLAWVRAHTTRGPAEIAAWSRFVEERPPSTSDGHAWFAESIKITAPDRDDVGRFFDLLDLDDYVSFGGKG
jgi:hypothetical protein